MKRLGRCLKQLLPLKHTAYYHVRGGDLICSTWRTWLNRVYGVQTIKIDLWTEDL
jgi:hypothetical protein